MGWFDRFKDGLKKTSQNITSGITEIFTTQKPTAEQIAELEELLILADMGPEVAAELCAEIARQKLEKDNATDLAIKEILAKKIEQFLSDPQKNPNLFDQKPTVIVVCGINGSGKTTTIGKLIPWLCNQGKSVRVVAADTFRAAAVEQLKHWCDHAHVPIEIAESASDPAALCYKGFVAVQNNQEDVLLIDTAGRLHNKTDLMDELAKIQRVLQKIDPQAPHEGWLVLDATGGQNLIQQVEIFQKFMKITGLIVTKMDGTAKGGVVVHLAQKYKIYPIFIGVGEGKEDLQPFVAQDFARALLGLDAP